MSITANFETGTNGNTVAVGDAGSATAWDLVTVTAPGTLTYDTAHTYDTLAAKVVSSTATAGVFAMWSTALGTVTDHYGRIYLYFTTNPTDTNHPYIVGCLNGASLAGGWNVGSAGKIQLVDGAVVVTATMTNAITLNAWVRVEWHFIHSATVGQLQVKLFNSPDSTTVTETLTSAVSWNGQPSVDRIRFGLTSASPTGYGTFWMDNILANATSYPGPVPAQQVDLSYRATVMTSSGTSW